MKKTVLFLMAIYMLLNPIGVFASENPQYNKLNNQYLMFYEDKDIDIDIFTMDYVKDDISYSVVYLGNIINVYSESGELLSQTVVLDSEVHQYNLTKNFSYDNQIDLLSLVDDYDKWRGWNDVTTTTFQFDETDLTISIVTATLQAYFTKNYLSAVDTVLQGIAIQIVTGKMKVATVSLQYNWNQYCSILRKERGTAGNEYTSESIYWTATPWDYTGTVETACRILTEKY